MEMYEIYTVFIHIFIFLAFFPLFDRLIDGQETEWEREDDTGQMTQAGIKPEYMVPG